jgi:hypothetical protein
MFGVALSLAKFALVEQQLSVSSPILMRGAQAMVARTIKPYGAP